MILEQASNTRQPSEPIEGSHVSEAEDSQRMPSVARIVQPIIGLEKVRRIQPTPSFVVNLDTSVQVALSPAEQLAAYIHPV